MAQRIDHGHAQDTDGDENIAPGQRNSRLFREHLKDGVSPQAFRRINGDQDANEEKSHCNCQRDPATEPVNAFQLGFVHQPIASCG